MKHIDLFSGIGGFALAAKKVWGDDYENVLFCDNNKFCQAVLRKNFGKEIKVYGDIRTITTNTTGERLCDQENEQKLEGTRSDELDARKPRSMEQVDLLTGGFPCQPFSCAGKRRGTEDDRYLWDEMLRVIKIYEPRWVVAENVRGLLTIQQGVVFGKVLADLESANYEVQSFVIPAVAVNATHRRDRVWIIAHSLHDGRDGKQATLGQEHSEGTDGTQTWQDAMEHDTGLRGTGKETNDAPDFIENPLSERSGRRLEGDGQVLESGCPETENAGPDWTHDWLEVATELCGVDDWLPARVDGLELSKAKHRVERLKALGNSIVPQVVVEIFKAIKITGVAKEGDK